MNEEKATPALDPVTDSSLALHRLGAAISALIGLCGVLFLQFGPGYFDGGTVAFVFALCAGIVTVISLLLAPGLILRGYRRYIKSDDS